MGTAAGQKTVVLLGARNLSAFFHVADSTSDVSPLDTTGMGGAAGDGHEFIPGIGTGTATLQGFYDGDADKVEVALNEALKAAAGMPVTFGPNGAAVGAEARLLLAKHTRVHVASPVDGVCAIQTDIQASNTGVQRGAVLHAVKQEDASGQEASVDNGAASASGGAAHLHVTVSNDDVNDVLVVRVEGSATGAFGAEKTTVATFAVVEGSPAYDRVEVSGAVPRYLRAAWEKTAGPGGGSGAWTFAVAFGRG